MRFYLGNSGKLYIYLGKERRVLELYTPEIIISGIQLMSSEPYYLRDKNGKYFTVKEE